MKAEFEPFVRDFVNHLRDNNVAIFAGAGLSKAAGYVNWKELLEEIAEDVGLKIELEEDLISLAQYHVNQNNRHKINQKILDEFVEGSNPTENHVILSRLPIATYWTTNYDKLLEDSLAKNHKRYDVKIRETDFHHSIHRRDAVIYKMHGDVSNPSEAVITKEDYERYYLYHNSFLTALNGDLTTKTFLFLGFSFTDPNITYIISRLNNVIDKKSSRQHYLFLKRPVIGDSNITNEAELDYAKTKQRLLIDDLKIRYNIKALLIDEFSEITDVLKEIERRYKKQTIFISGSSCGEYGRFGEKRATDFIHNLTKQIIQKSYTIVNGFGVGVGSAVINGALDAIDSEPQKFSDSQLVMKPFPQFVPEGKNIQELWEAYRKRIIPIAGIAIFVFGNKKDTTGNVVLADGVKKEFNIAIENGVIPIPIAATGYMSKEIFDLISEDSSKYLAPYNWLWKELCQMNSDVISENEIIDKVINIILKLNK
ncbi:hypothetical protein HMPREF1212_03804 [Parabacteroides sp. HGS0025]|uniref:SIR2 family protein n=1 Tax=Parabacteroides sp. HGS0025 TaxID=1078087 RepID=UPI0006174FE6|nr:SIR2 family protein [Parabacteroides sp. HGS0025]KKB46310.1 hypothetical protein HMPREF1212_03804 [Parabacteroides sp. HGS0025]